jgi:hypothetical protein
MDFVAAPIELWLGYRTANGEATAVRIVGWDAAQEPVPIAVFEGVGGSVAQIGPPNHGLYWIEGTRDAAIAAASPAPDMPDDVPDITPARRDQVRFGPQPHAIPDSPEGTNPPRDGEMIYLTDSPDEETT